MDLVERMLTLEEINGPHSIDNMVDIVFKILKDIG